MQPTAVVQFQARLFEEGQLLHNQLTSLPSNDTRIRTAQGLKNGAPSCPSFWIERRVKEVNPWKLLTISILARIRVYPDLTNRTFLENLRLGRTRLRGYANE